MVTVRVPVLDVTQLPLRVLGGWVTPLMAVMVEPVVPGTRVKLTVWPAKPTGPDPVSCVRVMVKTWSDRTSVVEGTSVELGWSRIIEKKALPFTVREQGSKSNS